MPYVVAVFPEQTDNFKILEEMVARLKTRTNLPILAFAQSASDLLSIIVTNSEKFDAKVIKEHLFEGKTTRGGGNKSIFRATTSNCYFSDISDKINEIFVLTV